MTRQRSRPVVSGPAEEKTSGDGLSAGSLPQGADRSLLRQALDDAIAEDYGSKLSMKDLTVLAPQNDPFRIDRSAAHRDGAWLAMTARELGLGNRRIHLRGLHYMVLGRTKPDGKPYTNTEADWLWLSSEAGKAARWLGYIPFDQIVDQRNAAPELRIFTPPEPSSYITVGLDVDLPDADDIVPQVGIADFRGAQPYKIVMVGEKSSLEPVLAPIAETFKADLYLPTGCLSDTLIYRMAQVGADDGRPMVVLYFSDCDPAGWNMPIEVGRKLQAFQVLEFDFLEFEVHRVALYPDQVREYGLPSTPLKDTEKRAGAWLSAMRVEQTEIDALASLRPDLLRTIARDAIAPFYDTTLDERVFQAQSDWLDEAQGIVDNASDQEHLDRLRAEAESRLEELREEIDAINGALHLDVSGFHLPAIEIPEAEIDYMALPQGLVDSRWTFVEQCEALKDSKAYLDGGGRVA